MRSANDNRAEPCRLVRGMAWGLLFSLPLWAGLLWLVHLAMSIR